MALHITGHHTMGWCDALGLTCSAGLVASIFMATDCPARAESTACSQGGRAAGAAATGLVHEA